MYEQPNNGRTPEEIQVLRDAAYDLRLRGQDLPADSDIEDLFDGAADVLEAWADDEAARALTGPIAEIERAYAARSYMRPDPVGYFAERRRNRIGPLRRVQRLTQRQVAEHLGVHPSFVGRMEHGVVPIPKKHREQLAELFGVSTVWLLGEER